MTWAANSGDETEGIRKTSDMLGAADFAHDIAALKATLIAAQGSVQRLEQLVAAFK